MKKDYPFNIFFLHHITQKSFVLTQTQSKKHSGFTLLELMVTVAIIAILAAIALPAYSNYIKRSEAKSAGANLVALSVVIEGKYLKTLSYTDATTTSTAATQAYATAWQAPTDNFTYTASVTASSKMYTLTASGNGCTLTLDQANRRTVSGGSACGGLTSW